MIFATLKAETNRSTEKKVSPTEFNGCKTSGKSIGAKFAARVRAFRIVA